jgi:hypothetical protein
MELFGWIKAAFLLSGSKNFAHCKKKSENIARLAQSVYTVALLSW